MSGTAAMINPLDAFNTPLRNQLRQRQDLNC